MTSLRARTIVQLCFGAYVKKRRFGTAAFLPANLFNLSEQYLAVFKAVFCFAAIFYVFIRFAFAELLSVSGQCRPFVFYFDLRCL